MTRSRIYIKEDEVDLHMTANIWILPKMIRWI